MQKTVKPGPGRRLRDEKGRLVPESGIRVNVTGYWTRRVAAGDAVYVAAEPAAEPESKKAKKSSE